MHPSYARSQPTSRPELYEFSLVKTAGKISRADTHRLRLKLLVKDSAVGGRNLEVDRSQARNWDG